VRDERTFGAFGVLISDRLVARLAVASLGGWTIASMAMATPGLPLVYP
jgi:hypothetical protein